MSQLVDSIMADYKNRGIGTGYIEMAPPSDDRDQTAVAIVVESPGGVVVMEFTYGLGHAPYVTVTSMDSGGDYVDPIVTGPVIGSVTLTLPES